MIRSALQLWSDLRRKSGASIAPRIVLGVAIGAVGMALGVVLQANHLFKQPASGDSRLMLASAKRAPHPGKAQVGHLLFTVTSARMQRVPDPKDPDDAQILAHIDVRITDVQGISDYIDNETFRLILDGDALTHSNNVNVTIYEKSSASTQLVFVLPEEVSSAELLVGRRSDGAAVRIPVELTPRRMADGS